MSQGRSPLEGSEALIADAGFPWDNAYEVLNRRLKTAGQPTLGPMSPMRDVHDAFFDLQVGASADDVSAWHQLKAAPRRLVIDFFHYPVPDFRMETLDPASLERPMPVEQPDLLALAGCAVDLGGSLEAPAKVPTYELPIAQLIDFSLADLLPSPLCVATPQLSDVIEVNDDTP